MVWGLFVLNTGYTVTVKLAVLAQIPGVGVKVYIVVAVLFSGGSQVPVMPLFEVVGSGDRLSPAQMGAIAVKTGATIGFTIIVIVVVSAHKPGVGVKVYVVVSVLLICGDHVPVIPLFEVVGSGEITSPTQIGPTAVKVGVTFGLIVSVPVAVVVPQPPFNETV